QRLPLFPPQWPRSFRTPHAERRGPSAERNGQDAGQPEVGNADRMIRVQMREEKLDASQRNAQLPQTRRTRAAAVEHEPFRSGFDQNAGTEAVRSRSGASRAEQDHSEVGSRI